ncbi:hypothetical protein KR215_007384 [Drosophila sulfurigaster]|nr:hypothetical protein KR215_007384 [Drosophila sulfurigaster]
MDKRELQMLEMMRNILGVDSPDLASGRSQRSHPMLFANSVPCEDSLPEDTNDSFNFFDEDLDDSDECNDFGRPCEEPKPPLEPCPNPLVPMDHPCFVRVIVLRTPLMRHDPCTNFTLAMQATSTTSTTAKPKGRKCKPKVKKAKPKPEQRLASVNNINSTSSSTSSSTSTTTSTVSTSIDTTTELPTTSSTESETSPTSTEEPPTTTAMTTTTTEEPTTTTTTTSTTTSSTTPLTTTPTTTTESVVYSRNNQLKSLRGRRRKQGRRRPSVPDAPRIKLDGAMQSSDALPVFQSTEVSELRSRPETTTKPTDLETTTPECVEDTDEVEAESEHKGTERETEELVSGSEDCEDAEDQDTNLCPQFSAPEEPANMRLLPASRYRKPVKNYVEPILYEGQGFAKPRQRIGMLQPQRRDYYVSNKQIMPRPRPKYREPVPHSIYMNNIIRGVKCSDEVPGHRHANPHPHPRRYRNGKPAGPTQRGWVSRRHGPGYAPAGSQPTSNGHIRQRPNPLYGLSSAEDLDSYGHDSEYYDDASAERLNWPREHHAPGSSSPTVDPCQAEHRQERERERARELERENDRERDNDHMLQYQQPVAPRFFT